MNQKSLEISFFLILLLAAIALLFFVLLPYSGALLLAAVFAIVFRPLYERLRGYMPRWEGTAALFTIALIFLLIFTPLTLVGIRLFGEAQDLYAYLVNNRSLISEQITAFAGNYASVLPPHLSVDIDSFIRQFLLYILQNIGPIFAGVSQIVGSVFLSLLALYYLLKDGARVRQALTRVSPLADHYDHEIFERLHLTVNSVVRGTLTIALLQGIMVGIGFSLFGVPHALVWGTIGVVASLIPIFGAAVVMVPAAGYLFLSAHTAGAIGLLVWGTVAVGLIDNLLRPYLLQQGVSIHPFLILLSVIGGIRFFGPIGFLVGPLILSLFFALLDIYPHLVLGENPHAS